MTMEEIYKAEVECLRKQLKLALEENERLNTIIKCYKSTSSGKNEIEGENHDKHIPLQTTK